MLRFCKQIITVKSCQWSHTWAVCQQEHRRAYWQRGNHIKTSQGHHSIYRFLLIRWWCAMILLSYLEALTRLQRAAMVDTSINQPVSNIITTRLDPPDTPHGTTCSRCTVKHYSLHKITVYSLLHYIMTEHFPQEQKLQTVETGPWGRALCSVTWFMIAWYSHKSCQRSKTTPLRYICVQIILYVEVPLY